MTTTKPSGSFKRVELVQRPDGRLEHIHGEATRITSALGPVKIERASDVVFDGDAGGWRIKFDPRLGIADPAVVFHPCEREAAIGLEVELLREQYLHLGNSRKEPKLCETQCSPIPRKTTNA